MNLLDKTGILEDSKIDNKLSEVLPIDNNKEIHNKKNIKKKKNDFNKNNFYKNLIISIIVLFCFFSIFVFINSSILDFKNNNYSFISLIEIISENNFLIIQSIELKNNKIKIIIDSNKEEYLYNNLSDIENIYSNIKFKINSGLNQIWIEETYITSNEKNINEIFNIISNIDNLNVELEIINNSLIVVGGMDDFMKVFDYFRKVNLNNFEFDLKLIDYGIVNNYYRLSVK